MHVSRANWLFVGVLGLAAAAVAMGDVVLPTGVVRHAPSLNSGRIEGSLQVLLGETFAINGGFVMTDDLLVVGSPRVTLNGRVNYAGTLVGAGSASPSNYNVLLNGNVTFGYLVTRSDAVVIPSVAAVPSPTGSRSVTVNSAGQSLGSFATLRNLTLNGNAGLYDIPPGVYGRFSANANSGFRLGVAGSTLTAVYNFDGLTLNGNARIEVVSPVMIRVRTSITVNGSIATGDPSSAVWIELPSGGLTLNGGSRVYASVLAPAGQVIINGNSLLEGSLQCDRFTLNGSGILRIAAGNLTPTAAWQTVAVAAGETLPITLSGADPEGAALSFVIASQPSHGSLSGSAPVVTYVPSDGYHGPDAFTFTVSDGSLTSAPATISIRVDAPPPRGFADTYGLNEGDVLVINSPGVLGNDSGSGGVMTAQLGVTTTFGALVLHPTGAFTFQPNPGFYGNDFFTYSPVEDGVVGGTTLVMLRVNARPLPVGRTITTPMNAPVDVVLDAVDPDDSILTFRLENSPARGVLSGDVATRHVHYLPDWNVSGGDAFTFLVTDPLNASAVGTITLDVTSANVAPVARIAAQTDSVSPAFPVNFDGTSSYDLDGTVVRYEWDFDNDGNFDAEGALAQHTFAASGDVSVRLRVTDNAGTTGTVSRTIHLNQIPVAEILNPPSLTTFVDGDAIPVDAKGTDADGVVNRLDLLVDGVARASAAFDQFSFTAGSLAAGEHTLAVRAVDDRGAEGISPDVSIVVSPARAAAGNFIVHPDVVTAELAAVRGVANGGEDEISTTAPLYADNYFSAPVNYTATVLNNRTWARTGYLVQDSNSTADVVYAWQEISDTGYKLPTSQVDDGFDEVPLTFKFPFFNQSFDRVFIGSNGVLSFGQGVTRNDNESIPAPTAPSFLIAAFWTDLLPGLQIDDGGGYYGGGGVINASAIYAQDFGDHLVVQFSADASFWGGAVAPPPEDSDLFGVPNFSHTGRYTFQIVLYKNGDIDLVYRWMSGVTDVATIGIQNGDATDGVSLAFDQPFVTNHRTIRLKREARGDPWFTLDGVDGSLPIGGHDDMNVHFFSRPDFAPGLYSGQIRVDHDQPGLPPYVVDVGLNIFAEIPTVNFARPDPSGRKYYVAGETIPLQIDASDADGVVRSVAVTGNGEQIGFWTTGPFQKSWTPPQPGDYTLVATATDNDGHVGSSAPLTVSVSVDSDGDGLPDAFEYDYFGTLDYGGLDDFDGDGRSNRKELALGSNPTLLDVFVPANRPPVARFTTARLSGEAPFVVNFDGNSTTDDDGEVVNWLWDFDGDGSWDDSGAQVQHTFAAAGTYAITLDAVDDQGAESSTSVSIRVRPAGTALPPVAAFEASLYAAPAARSITFDSGASSDPDGTIASFAWDFGDGSSSTESSPTHYFDRVGIYPVRLTVADDDGLAASIEKHVTITHNDRGVFSESNGYAVLEAEHATMFDGHNDPFAWRVERMRFIEGEWGARLQYAGDDLRQPPPVTTIAWSDAAEIGWQVHINTPGFYYYAARYTTNADFLGTSGNLAWRVGVDGVEVSPVAGDPIGSSTSSVRWRRGVPLGELSAGDHTIEIRRFADLVWVDQIVIALDKAALPADQSHDSARPGTLRSNLPPAPPVAQIAWANPSMEIPIDVVLDASGSTASRGPVASYNWAVRRYVDPATGTAIQSWPAVATSPMLATEIDDFNSSNSEFGHPLLAPGGTGRDPDGVEIDLTVVDGIGQIGEANTRVSIVDPLESITSPVDLVVDDTSPQFSAGATWRVSQATNDFIFGVYYPGGAQEYGQSIGGVLDPLAVVPVNRLELRDWFGSNAHFSYSGVAPATFTAPVSESADYLVFVRWPRTNEPLDRYVDPQTGEAAGLDLDGAAVVTVSGADGSSEVHMDQHIGGGHWRLAGIHHGNAGDNVTVSIASSASGKLTMADAARFVRASTSAGNATPVADFSFASIGNGSITFDGTASHDPDGRLVAWFWEFGDGHTSRAKRPTHQFVASSTYSVSLTVVDDQLGVQKTTRSVQVPSVPVSTEIPVARARLSAVRGEVPFVLQCDGSLSTDDTGIVHYRWDTILQDDPWNSVTPFSADGDQASFVFNKPGTYPVTLTVTNHEGATDHVTLSIEALPRGVSTRTPQVIDDRDPAAHFTGRWVRQDAVVDLRNGIDVVAASQVGDSVVFRPSLPAAGLYQVSLRYPSASTEPPLRITVQDSTGISTVYLNHAVEAGQWQLLGTFLFGSGAQGSISFAKERVGQGVLADAVRWVPVGGSTSAGFTFGFAAGSNAPATVVFDSSSTVSDGAISSYAWDFGDGSQGVGASPQHTFTAAGTYSVTLAALDVRGSVATVTRYVRVDATRTTPVPAAEVTPVSGTDPLVVQFSGAASSDPAGIAVYHWDFGDDVDFSGVEGSHRYSRPGTYSLVLTVTNLSGVSAQTTRVVTVAARPVIGAPGIHLTSTNVFSGLLGFDAGNVPAGATLTWDFGDGQAASITAPTHQYAAPGIFRVVLIVDTAAGTTTLVRWITVGDAGTPGDAGRNDSAAAFILYTPLSL